MNAVGSPPLPLLFGGHPYLMRDVEAEDAAQVLRLFTHAFKLPADQDWFNWKYLAGRGTALGLWDHNGVLRAHCAGTPRSILWRGQRLAGLQIGDVMVSEEIRGLVMRKGPFQQVSSRFFTTRVGLNNPFQFAWGFPNQRHMRLGLALGLFWDGGNIIQLTWPAVNNRVSLWWSLDLLKPYAKGFDAQIDSVWEVMSKDLQDHVLGVRDSAYVRWRFLARPGCQYHLFGLRQRMTDSVKAVVIMRFDSGKAELLDVVGPRRTLLPALRAAIHEAARNGFTTLSAWVSPVLAELLQNTGATSEPSGGSIAIIRETVYTDTQLKAARWWWMGGDTDFL